MADVTGKHIDELVSVTRKLGDEDVLAIVQNNLTRKATILDLKKSINGDNDDPSETSYFSSEKVTEMVSDVGERITTVRDSLSSKITEVENYNDEMFKQLQKKIDDNYTHWDSVLYNEGKDSSGVPLGDIHRLDYRIDENTIWDKKEASTLLGATVDGVVLDNAGHIISASNISSYTEGIDYMNSLIRKSGSDYDTTIDYYDASLIGDINEKKYGKGNTTYVEYMGELNSRNCYPWGIKRFKERHITPILPVLSKQIDMLYTELYKLNTAVIEPILGTNNYEYAPNDYITDSRVESLNFNIYDAIISEKTSMEETNERLNDNIVIPFRYEPSVSNESKVLNKYGRYYMALEKMRALTVNTDNDDNNERILSVSFDPVNNSFHNMVNSILDRYYLEFRWTGKNSLGNGETIEDKNTILKVGESLVNRYLDGKIDYDLQSDNNSSMCNKVEFTELSAIVLVLGRIAKDYTPTKITYGSDAPSELADGEVYFQYIN